MSPGPSYPTSFDINTIGESALPVGWDVTCGWTDCWGIIDCAGGSGVELVGTEN